MLVLVSAVSLLAGGLAPWLGALDLLAVLVFAVDVLRTPRPDRVRVQRVAPERAGLSRPLERRLLLECPRARDLWVEVEEEFPGPFRVLARTWSSARAPASEAAPSPALVEPRADDPSGGPEGARFDGAGRVELVRTYRSDLRGSFALGDLRVRLRGRLGLVERQTRFRGRTEIAVEPPLTHLGETLRLAASDRWQDLGVRQLRRYGGEREFESLREYVTGDDVRRIDWKAWARRGKPMVRSYQVERGQELILLVDQGRRMRVTSDEGERAGWTKLDWALDALLELAAVALSKGDRVGAASFDRALGDYVAPAKGSRQLLRLSRAFFALQPTEKDSDLALALRELAVRHRRRATVIVISDVADPLSFERERRALASAAGRHRLIFAALDDPQVRAAAAGEEADAALRAAALELVKDRSRALRALAASGARVLDALPAEAAAPLLAAWLDERRAG